MNETGLQKGLRQVECTQFLGIFLSLSGVFVFLLLLLVVVVVLYLIEQGFVCCFVVAIFIFFSGVMCLIQFFFGGDNFIPG